MWRSQYAKTLEERFWEKVETQPGGCWIWTAAMNGAYGVFNANGKTWMAHRYAYTQAKGPIPSGMTLDHRCRVRLCVNPDHLELVPRVENRRRQGRVRPIPANSPLRQAVQPRRYRGRSLEERFWEKVDKAGPDGCWLWTAARNSGGYGALGQKKRWIMAHRYAYELLVGPIPVGMTIDHLCRTRLCVNPAHMELMTHRENNLRGNSAAARNARATHCPAGHEYTPDNTYVQTDGSRKCRTCYLAHAKAVRATYRELHPVETKTHCKQGHEFSPENTRIATTGQRVCKTCMRRWVREARLRRLAREAAASGQKELFDATDHDQSTA